MKYFGMHYVGRKGWELNLLNFKKRRLRGCLNAVYSYLMWESRKDRLLSELHRKTMRGKRFKLDYKVSPLDLKNFFFIWLNLLLILLWVGDWTRWPPLVPCYSNCSAICCICSFKGADEQVQVLSRLSFVNYPPILAFINI